MKLMKLRSPLWSLFVMALLVGLPFLCSEAQARGGFGGYHGHIRGSNLYAVNDPLLIRDTETNRQDH